MPEREDDHLTPATRLLEKRREMSEVEQALAAQKEACFKRNYLSSRGRFPCFHSLKPEAQSRVCITVENSPNSPECLDEAVETRKKFLYCFYKIFLKDNSTNEGKCSFFYFSIEKEFLIHAHISYQSIKTCV